MKKKKILIVILFIPILLWFMASYFLTNSTKKYTEKFVVHKYIDRLNGHKIYYVLVNDFNGTFAEWDGIIDFRTQFLQTQKEETGYIYFLKSFDGLESRINENITFYSSSEHDHLIVAYYYNRDSICELIK